MSTILIIFWIFNFCIIADFIVLAFPLRHNRATMNHKINKIKICFLILCVLGALVSGYISFVTEQTDCIEYRVACLIILAIGFLVFCIFLYYPSVKFLTKNNASDQEKINQLTNMMFSCIYSEESKDKQKSLEELKLFIQENNVMLKEYGLYMYLHEYIKLINPTTYTAQDNMNMFLLNKCDQIKDSLAEFMPNPFPNIGLILSFLGSTTFVIIVSILSITD